MAGQIPRCLRRNQGRAPGWPANGLPVCTDPTPQATNDWSFVPDGLGGGVVAWHDYRNTMPGGTSIDIYAQRVFADGNLAAGWPMDGAPVIQASGAQAFPVTVADGSGARVAS